MIAREFFEALSSLSTEIFEGEDRFRIQKIPAKLGVRALATILFVGAWLLTLAGLLTAVYFKGNPPILRAGIALACLPFPLLLLLAYLAKPFFSKRAFLVRAVSIDNEFALVLKRNIQAPPIYFVWEWRLLCEFEYEGEMIQVTPDTDDSTVKPFLKEQAEERFPAFKERILSAVGEDGTVLLRCNPRDVRSCRVVFGDEDHLTSGCQRLA